MKLFLFILKCPLLLTIALLGLLMVLFNWSAAEDRLREIWLEETKFLEN